MNQTPSTGHLSQQTRHRAWRGWDAILEGVGCLVGCRLQPLDGYVSVCLVLTIEVYESGKESNDQCDQIWSWQQRYYKGT